jgi:hypothetical protein
MKDIKIGDYVLKINKNDYGQLYGRVFDTKGNPVNKEGASLQWSMGQQWFYPEYSNYDLDGLKETFVVWLYNLGKLPHSHPSYKKYEG